MNIIIERNPEMKKLLAALIAAVLLLSLMAVPASAKDKAHFYLTGPSSAKVGDTVKVILSVEGDYSAHIINLMVYFDNTSFRYLGKTYGEAYSDSIDNGGFGLCDITEKGNAISLGIMMITDPTSAEGELLELSFEVLSTASSSADFKVSVEQFSYMPVGQMFGQDIDYTADGLTMKLSGGSGASTTPVPSPGGWTSPTKAPSGSQEPVSTPGPGSPTKNPSGTVNPSTQPAGTEPSGSEPAGTETSETDSAVTQEPSEAPVSTDIAETEAPSAEPSPGSSENAEPVSSEQPGNDDNGTPTKNNAKKTAWIVICCCAAAAALAVLIAALKKRSSDKKK